MSCDVLTANFAADARPQGMLAENARPQADGICRDYDFGGTQWLIAIGPGPVLYSIGGDPLRAI